MPTPLNQISFTHDPVPNTQFTGDLGQLLDLFTSLLKGSLANGALVGQIGGTEPVTDIGLWLNGGVFYQWDSVTARYLPTPLTAGSLVGTDLFTTTLVSGAKTANISLQLPDKNGSILATLSDLATPLATVTATGTPLTLNWTNIGQHGRLYANVAAATVISEAGTALDGQIYDLWIEVGPSITAATYGLTWPTTWVLSATTSAVPVVTTDATHRSVDHYKIYHIGTITFVEFLKSYSISTTAGGQGTDVTPPVVTEISVPVLTATISIQFNEALRGGALDITKWAVKKAGVTNPMISANASGSTVTLVVTNTYSRSSAGTVQYTGTDVKDLAGNAAAVFGPSAIIVDSGDIGGGGG